MLLTGYSCLFGRYLVVTSAYLIVTTGYFSLLPVTSGYFWFLVLVTTYWSVVGEEKHFIFFINGATRVILRLPGKSPWFNERLKTYLTGWNMFSRQRFTIADEYHQNLDFYRLSAIKCFI